MLPRIRLIAWQSVLAARSITLIYSKLGEAQSLVPNDNVRLSALWNSDDWNGRVNRNMFNWMRNRRMFVLMIVFIVFVAVMGFSIGDRKKLSWPENFVLDSSAFVQEWFYRPAGYLAGLFKDVANLHDVYKENEQLRIAAAAYARDSIKFNYIEKKNIELEEALKFTKRQKSLYDYKYLIAQVVAVSNNPYDETIRINLGSKDGIRVNMVVITTQGKGGLVGIVTQCRSVLLFCYAADRA